MNYISCTSCGIVIDADIPTLEHEAIFNHDGDKISDAVRCPLCKELISLERWEDAE